MSPGTYLRLRRQAAGLTRDDIALITETEPTKVCARRRAEWLSDIENDGPALTGDLVEILRSAFNFDPAVLHLLVAIHAGADLVAPQLCRVCACSWLDPCDGDSLGSCSWVSGDPTLCTACWTRAAAATPDAPTAAEEPRAAA
jgi:hypothetical protein